MSILKLVENGKGNFDIRGFGPTIVGQDGERSFDVEIKSLSGQIDIIISDVKIKQIFTKFDLKGDHFLSGIYVSTDFIEVSRKANLITISATNVLVKTVTKLQKDGKIKNRSKVGIIFETSKGVSCALQPAQVLKRTA